MSSTTPAGDRPAPFRLRRVRRLSRALAPTAAAFGSVLAFAAFTDDAHNDGNRAVAADVTITEDVPASAALFDVVDWQPGEDGDTVARCIGVRNDGSIPLPISLRLAGPPGGDLAEHVDMRVVRGTRDPAHDGTSCATFTADAGGGEVFDGELADFPATARAALDDGGARLAVGAERAYRVTWTLQDTEAAEGRTVSGVHFRWETTSAG